MKSPKRKPRIQAAIPSGLYKLRASDSTGSDISCIETGIIKKSSNANDTVGDYSIIKLLGIFYNLHSILGHMVDVNYVPI